MLIAGPNLTIERTLTMETFCPGEVLRFDGVTVRPGGKGVNVTRVARALDVPAVLVGFTPRSNGCRGRRADRGRGPRAPSGADGR